MFKQRGLLHDSGLFDTLVKMSPDRLIFGGQSAALSTRTIITTQRPQTPHQFLELSEEPGNVIHTRFLGFFFFWIGTNGRLPQNPKHSPGNHCRGTAADL